MLYTYIYIHIYISYLLPSSTTHLAAQVAVLFTKRCRQPCRGGSSSARQRSQAASSCTRPCEHLAARQFWLLPPAKLDFTRPYILRIYGI